MPRAGLSRPGGIQRATSILTMIVFFVAAAAALLSFNRQVKEADASITASEVAIATELPGEPATDRPGLTPRQVSMVNHFATP